MPEFKTLPIDLVKWDAVWGFFIAAHTPYVFGGKVRTLHEYPPVLPHGGIDCSGAVREAVYHATGGAVDIGDGSYNQGEFLKAYGLKVTDRQNNGLEDGHLRISVHHPDALDDVGHIWGVRNKVTSESFGGHGPGHRAWDARLRSGHSLNELATLTFVAT